MHRTAATAVLVASALGCACAAGCTASPGSSGTSAAGSRAAGHSRGGATTAVVRASTLPWALPTALSRASVVSSAGRLLVIGGLTATDATTGTVLSIDPRTGASHQVGTLPAPVHDAAASLVRGSPVVFGGGASTTTAAVQRVAAGASRVGRLPAPRSDLTAVTSGSTTYLLGGYDGSRLLPDVLATTDAVTFRTVARLARPVRYAAAVAANHEIWVFGGTTGQVPTRDIQRVDVTTGRTSVVGRLPVPLSDAVGVDLGGQILIAGGRVGGSPSDGVYRFDPATDRVSLVTRLPIPASDMGAAVIGDTAYFVGGDLPGATPTVQRLQLVESPRTSAAPAAAGWPFTGRLLIADRGNNRLLLVSADKRVLWKFPSAKAAAPRTGFYFPDDAFFTRHGTAIISNQEGNDTIVEISFPGGQSLWSYGHPRTPGPGPGYLHEPDDAYLLRDGRVVVADANNCRVVIISARGRQVGQIGTTGVCRHDPPTALGYPNGDTPLADGNLLISEVDGSWVSEYTLRGALVWTVRLPVSYPSDPQQLGPDRYLVADYARPGALVEFDRAGRVLWRYGPSSGPGMLDHPSLAEQLPGGLICVNDDYRHRVVIIDPATKRIVWQYGVTDRKGRDTGYLNTPDGFDLLQAGGRTPTHPTTG